ncbi:cyclic di-GMP phosphodiesterase response regulator RpfG [bacterium BMS3Abin01]|nr:cyclic di-GMP phosphodiesterase response regulator RpfG [bacterium BMS3Abin01]
MKTDIGRKVDNTDNNDLILVVDDSEQNVQLIEAYLTADGYRTISAADGYEALEAVRSGTLPDLIILDIMMPGMNGYEVCRELKEGHDTQRIPVMMLTALQDMEDKVRGFEAGADEFLSKPVEKMELLVRVKALLRTKHLNEDLESARDVIYTLALAIEANDPYTRGHSERVSAYAYELAKRLGLSAGQADIVRDAGILHDVGKIGISEAILQKPGPLTSEELVSVQDHPVIGEKICKPLRSANMLLTVIRHHQERFDGGGYPDSLKGKEIPVEARVISVADAYDAMTSPRSYRPPMSQHRVLDVLRRESGKQWDPDVVAEFIRMIRDASLPEMAPQKESR